MSVPEKIHTPSPRTLELACPDYGEVLNAGHVIETDFAEALADSKITGAAISQGFDDIPDPANDGDVWRLHEERVDLGLTALRECVECPILNECMGARALSNIATQNQTPFEQQRKAKQAEVAKAISRNVSGAVLKGGFAMVQHGLERPTGDLDFDLLSLPTPTEKKQMRRVIEEAGGNAGAKKETDTTIRHAIPLRDGSRERPMKVEFRRVDSTDIDQDTTVINGTRVYKPEKILTQKVDAFLSRSKSRDVIDLSYLLSKFPDIAQAIPTATLEAVSRKLRPENSTGERQLNEEVIDQLSALEEANPAWINKDVAFQMVKQLSGKVDDILGQRSTEPQDAELSLTR